ncbi:unnamed protein product, partial [marine sediment metagenome]
EGVEVNRETLAVDLIEEVGTNPRLLPKQRTY